jgi:hypothetical protein
VQNSFSAEKREKIMPTPFNTFEDVDNYVSAHVATVQGIRPPAVAPANLPVEFSKFCDIWAAARPILVFIVRFLPGNWKKIVQPLIDFLDLLCPKAKNA